MEKYFIILIIGFCNFIVILSQQLTPVNDKVYLDTIQTEISGDLDETKHELVTNAKQVQAAAKHFAQAKLAHNLFRALRVLAVKELEQLPKQYRIRQPRQEDSEDTSSNSGGGGGGDDEDSVESSGSSSSGSSSSTAEATSQRTVPLIPVLAGILKSVFGGGENNTVSPLNVTHTLQHATKLVFFPFGNPFKGILSRPQRRPATAPPATVIKYVPIPVYPPTEPTTTTRRTTTPLIRLTGRRQSRSLVSPPSTNTNEESSSTVQQSNIPTYAPHYMNSLIHSVYAPAYMPLPNYKLKTTTESPSPAQSSTLIYASNHNIHDIVSATPQNLHQSSPELNVTSNYTTEIKIITSTTTKPKPTQMYPPVFAEFIPEKTTAKTESTHVVEVTEGNVVPDVKTQGTTTTTTTTTTEAPKPGLIYVDSIARDVQTGIDGIVKNLPDILKGAKEAIGLLANLREIFAQEEDA